MENSELYNSFSKSLYRIGTENAVLQSTDIDPSDIISGSLISTLGQSLGTISTGKRTFNNTEDGYMMGLDKGTTKFYLGQAGNRYRICARE